MATATVAATRRSWGQIICFKMPEGEYESLVAASDSPMKAFSVDKRGEKLAFARGQAGVVYELAKQTELWRTPPANAGLAAISPDGKLLATFGSRVQVFDIAAKKNIHTFPEGFSSDDFRTFSTSGKHFATRRHLWDVQTGKLVHELQGAGPHCLLARRLRHVAHAGQTPPDGSLAQRHALWLGGGDRLVGGLARHRTCHLSVEHGRRRCRQKIFHQPTESGQWAR